MTSNEKRSSFSGVSLATSSGVDKDCQLSSRANLAKTSSLSYVGGTLPCTSAKSRQASTLPDGMTAPSADESSSGKEFDTAEASARKVVQERLKVSEGSL